MRAQFFAVSRWIALRLDPGEDVLLSLQAAVRNYGLRNAVIVSGVGSLDRYHFHVVSTARLPPENAFVRGEGPFDILAVTGLVRDGKVHAHITFSDRERAMGGHLEEGCRILTFGVIVLAEAPDATFTDWDRVGTLASAE